MAEWKLNIQKQFADEIVAGRKMFEIRKEDDKIFNKGDYIEFYVGMSKFIANGEEHISFEGDHDIHGKVYEITYVIHGWGIKEGYCVFGIRELAPGGLRLKPDYEPETEMITRLNPEGEQLLEAIILTGLKERCERNESCEGCLYKKHDSGLCLLGGDDPREWLI